MSSFLSSLYILDISPLSNDGLVKIFSQSVGSLSVLLTVSFSLQSLLSFRMSHLLIVAFSDCATGVSFRQWSPLLMDSHFLFNKFQCGWIYVEVFDPLGTEFCAWK